MLKLLVLAVILRNGLCENSTEPTTTAINLTGTQLSGSDELGVALNESYNTNLSNDLMMSNALSGGIISSSFFENSRPDYTVISDIGAFKLHRQEVTWNEARRICANEGGHLIIIRSQKEEDAILKMSEGKDWWIGVHNRFGGEWITVLDEFLYQLGWSRWSTNTSPNPVVGSIGCGVYVGAGGGMTHYSCDEKKTFICKL